MKLLFAILLCLPVLAIDNSVTVYDAASAAHTARPMTIYRSFAQGEFASGSYPKPRIGGTVPSVWQVDAKTTWPDGSLQSAHISFRLDIADDGSAVVDFVTDANPCHLGNLATCQAAALDQAGMLAYDVGTGAGSWSATWYGTVNAIEYSASARTMLTAGAWRWVLRGPVVSGIIVEDRTSAFAYDFGWQYAAGVWGAPSTNSYKSLHPVFELRFYPDPDGAGALTAWDGVEVDAQIWNAGTTRRQMFNPIDLTLKTGDAEADTAYAVTGKSFHARSRRHYRTWSGTAPAAIVVDYNFPYLIHTKLIPPYNYSLAVADTLADYDLSKYTAELAGSEPQWCTDADNSNCAEWLKAPGTSGARGEIALIARWYLDYLYLMGHATTTVAKKLEVWQKLVIGNADAGGHAPIHYMETATNLTFFSVYDTTNAVGKFGSINARTGGWNAASGLETTYMPPVCSALPCDGRGYVYQQTSQLGGWTTYGSTNYNSHAPSFNAIPAFLTGYDYYIRGAQFEAAYMLATNNACTTGTNSGCRHNMKGIEYWEQQLRGSPWVMRNLLWATVLTPDAEAIEKAYFVEKLTNNVKFQEGVLLITDGVHAPADPTCPNHVQTDSAVFQPTYNLWCAGRNWWSSGQGGPGIPASNAVRLPTYGYTEALSSDGWYNTGRHTAGFWMSYLATGIAYVASTGAFLDTDGLPLFTHVRDAHAAFFAGRVLVSPKSMHLLGDIQAGTGPSGGGLCTANVADCTGAYVTNYTLGADMTAGQSTIVINSTEIRSTGYYWLDYSWWKVGDEWMKSSGLFTNNSPSTGKATITIYRADFGSTAAAHTAGDAVEWIPGFWLGSTNEYMGGYSVIMRGVLALLRDATKTGTYSPIVASDVFSGGLPNQVYATNPLWAFMPRESVQSVVATGGTGTASLTFLAPSAAPCKVFLGEAVPATSSDAADDDATNTYGRRQSYAATGLDAATHHYRITCGTARASGTVVVD